MTPQQMAEVIGNKFRPSPSYDSPVITSSTTPSNMISCSSMNIITTKDDEQDSGAANKALLSTAPSSSSLRILSFGDENEAIEYEIDEMEILNTQSAPKSYCEPSSFNVSGKKNKPPSSSCSKDHVLAERKRREKLSKLFVDLSTTIPYHKKNDKESLLGNTVEYIKELQSKVKALEQDIEIPTELALLVNKRPLLMDMDENSMFSNESSSRSQQPPLKIEAKLNGKTVILKIQCENHKGVVVKAMLEIEKLPITITNSSIMPFGDDSSLDMVIMAQVEDGASMMVRDLVENLSSTFKQILWET
ncbi:Myc-type basic helix-loop-helix (bHLH) domain-containing protein [Dioscorea alata]|uniref:Myc-type basic helix-loop-helix (BHLH) domain-containing protein n=1 Tax=Dioscorea alata TaxID=55571 RepID=A0ACB7WNQ2_DIOAL|nr:Myc-type basic helix-loop-helix (bHLH) domain-containing protein [Dioscorea alata]